jgi:hypothetical protein
MAREFLSAEQMAQSKQFGTSSIQTINNRFNDGVYHVYKRGGDTNRAKLTCSISARVRYEAAQYLFAKNYTWRQIGQILIEISGVDDNMIAVSVDSNETFDQIREQFLDTVKDHISVM